MKVNPLEHGVLVLIVLLIIDYICVNLTSLDGWFRLLIVAQKNSSLNTLSIHIYLSETSRVYSEFMQPDLTKL